MNTDFVIIAIVFIFSISIMPLKYIESYIVSKIDFGRDNNVAIVALVNGIIISILSYLILKMTKSKSL